MSTDRLGPRINSPDVPDPVRIQTVRIRIRVHFLACSISNERSLQARFKSAKISGLREPVDPEPESKNRISYFLHVVPQI